MGHAKKRRALRSQAREELTRLELTTNATTTCASLRGLRAKRTPLLRVAHVVPGSETDFYLLPFAGALNLGSVAPGLGSRLEGFVTCPRVGDGGVEVQCAVGAFPPRRGFVAPPQGDGVVTAYRECKAAVDDTERLAVG